MSEEQLFSIEDLTRRLIAQVDDDPSRPDLKDTPARVARAYQEMLQGYKRSLRDEIATFDNDHGYDDLIYSGDINFVSLCEHHMLPFFGQAHVAYVPDKKIVGLSKLARAVDIYAKRLQNQERITVQVAQELDELLQPKGVVVLLKARHFCHIGRGVSKQSVMKTIRSLGVLQDDQGLQDRFFRLINA